MSDYCRDDAKHISEFIKDIKAEYLAVSYNNNIYDSKGNSSRSKIIL
jgi:adenine-specific DNA methylase